MNCQIVGFNNFVDEMVWGWGLIGDGELVNGDSALREVREINLAFSGQMVEFLTMTFDCGEGRNGLENGTGEIRFKI